MAHNSPSWSKRAAATPELVPGRLCRCNQPGTSAPQPSKLPLTPELQIIANIDSIKINCKPGDLIVRLNDDIMSEIIRQIADSDKSYSHAGIIVQKNDKKLVCHIVPNDGKPNADTIKYDPIDSFINPKENLSCGWFRYDLSPIETTALIETLDSFHRRHVHFDRRFDLQEDDSMYCSEMLAKALQKATNNRMTFKTIYVPKYLIKMMLFYFRRYHPTYTQIEKTLFIPIESLYRVPGCTELMRTKLKILP